MLITMACSMNYDNEYYSMELARNQTLENLVVFSEKLHKVALIIKANKRKK